MRYLLEYVGDHVLEVHVDKRVLGYQATAVVRHNPLMPLVKQPSSGSDSMIIVDALLGVDGIDAVSLSSYGVTVSKGKAFRWQEVTPAVLGALHFHLADEDEKLEQFALPERRSIDPEEVFFSYPDLDRR